MPAAATSTTTWLGPERAVAATKVIPTMEATTGESPRQYTIDDRPARHVAPIVFVGGTGRSGTHIVAKLLGRHGKLT